MGLLQVIASLILVGVLLALLNKYGGSYIAASILKIINVFVVIVVILWLLSLLGILSAFNIPVPYFGK